FAKQPIIENLPKVGETNDLLEPVTSNSVSTPQEPKVVKNNKVIAPGIKKHKAKVSFKENQMTYQPQVPKPKKVGFLERLATPKPRKPRFLLRWPPTGRLFDQERKIVDSNESESQSDCSNGDNACTSNTTEPKIKRFPNSTSLLGSLGDQLGSLGGKERASCNTGSKEQSQVKRYYNARVRSRSFRLGDFVYQNNRASHAEDRGKLGPKWEGPYEVTKALGK
nr:reverse transcriptase domain-containing protein [Tanacetum cinerariifolium]